MAGEPTKHWKARVVDALRVSQAVIRLTVYRLPQVPVQVCQALALLGNFVSPFDPVTLIFRVF